MTDATDDLTAALSPSPNGDGQSKSQGLPLHPTPGDKFHIVALGGSAGSLDALERFFRHVPAHAGMAFVVVLHLLPNQDGELTKVLQTFTQLPVHEIEDGLRVQPGHVYVIPPGRDLSILHGTLLLLHPTQPPGRRMPIDFFLESLAKDAQERAVSVILSGLGTDGSLGLKLIMENFGMVMVQEPGTAAYPSMPTAAIATEFVDFVLAPEQMGAQVLDYAERPLLARAPRAGRAGRAAGPRPAKNLYPHPRPDGARLQLLQAQHGIPAHRTAHERAPDSGVFALRALLAGKPARGGAAL